MVNKELIFQKDIANKRIFVSRFFDAPKTNVWRAWTKSELLDIWWAPKPWKAITKSLDFSEGGHWLYRMQGPDGTAMWSRADYEKIDAENYFIVRNAFCDENGNVNPELPRMRWKNVFTAIGDTTMVEIQIQCDREEDLKKIIEMGFEEGFTSGLQNLEDMLVG